MKCSRIVENIIVNLTNLQSLTTFSWKGVFISLIVGSIFFNIDLKEP